MTTKIVSVSELSHFGTRLHWDYELADEPAPVPVAPPRRPLPKRRRVLDRAGFYEPRPEGGATTTRQAEALNLAISRMPSGHEGVINGVDATSNAPIALDQFTAYGQDVSNINVVAIGDVGKAKSSLLKTVFTTRTLPLGRQVIVIDKKRQSGRGEYSRVADAVQAPSIVFSTGGTGGPRLNLLDPAISLQGEHEGAEYRPEGQSQLVFAVVEDTMGRTLSETEKAATTNALSLVTHEAVAQGHEPLIGMVAQRMLYPNDGDTDVFGPLYKEEARLWGRDVALALRRLAETDLRGLVDQPTTDDVRAALEHPLVHFDVSQLPDSGPALRIVMTLINTWLSNRLAARSSRYQQTEMLVEEGWHLGEGSTGLLLRRNMKLSRGLGLSTVSAFHHISDFSLESPARALMQEAAIAYIYGQERYDDAAACASMYQLPAGSVETIMQLGQGQCLVKIGSRDPILMRHIRSPFERYLTDTDGAIKGRQG
ncbi:Type IV secretory pathway, VirB4 components [Nocardia otitidiscaviarum]|uniref:Type IV secretory pathway, VirB4 components n=1 Tax=Nocardia otitidiscaviarum TaxID=1823 RepID=A0A379JNI6_9NOCA|nr:ATP/GTP-binding protein [Nocardia otitidiscaviarum]SUD49583.1 Type IV secretory pathway, VirB4 components [Nocardia otitidiscaviarum]